MTFHRVLFTKFLYLFGQFHKLFLSSYDTLFPPFKKSQNLIFVILSVSQ